jgi:hypothetical protein
MAALVVGVYVDTSQNKKFSAIGTPLYTRFLKSAFRYPTFPQPLHNPPSDVRAPIHTFEIMLFSVNSWATPQGTAPGRTLCQISDEVIDTKKELVKIAGYPRAWWIGPCRRDLLSFGGYIHP